MYCILDPGSFVAVQFLQSVAAVTAKPAALPTEAQELSAVLPHHSLLTVYLENKGFAVTYLPVEENGVVGWKMCVKGGEA